jgi:hypothetical protein
VKERDISTNREMRNSSRRTIKDLKNRDQLVDLKYICEDDIRNMFVCVLVYFFYFIYKPLADREDS